MSVKKRTYIRGGVERTVWRARFYTYPLHGPRREVTKDFATRKEAVAWEREQAGKGRSRDVAVEKTKLKDAGLWERAEPVLRDRLAPKTLDHYRRAWTARVLPALGEVRLGRLAVGDLERAQAAWAAEGVGPSTVRQARLSLSAVLTVAVRDGLLTANPARDAKRPAGDVQARMNRNVGRVLTPGQLRELVEHVDRIAGERYAVLVDLMGTAGLRYGEASALHCGDVDQARRVIVVQRAVVEVAADDGAVSAGRRREGNLVWGPPKNGRSRTVPLPRHLAARLARLTDGKMSDDLVFRSERGARLIRRNTLVRKLNWRKLTADLGHHGFRIHDLRATAATNLLAAGVPPHVVRDILGHQDLRVTTLYARSHDDTLDQAAEMLNRYMNQNGEHP